MSSAIQSIIRRATRNPNSPWNILTFPTHERYETSLAATGHNFYGIRRPNSKEWKTHYAPVPDNYHLLPVSEGLELPPWVDFDMILSQNKVSQFRIAQIVAHQLHIPLINLEHTLPPNEWTPGKIANFRSLQGSINVFVSEYQKQMWGIDGIVNPTGIDTDVFCPPTTPEREPWALSVVNDWINRDWCCGFSLWREVTGFPSPAPLIPCKVLGDTPGLSQSAPDIPTLVKFYQTAGVYLNTTLVSSLPTVILEAMACGCPVVSTDTCLIPKNIIEHGVNGFVGSNVDELKGYTLEILNNPTLAKQIGDAGRQTILEKFSKQIFTDQWNNIFKQATEIHI